jgi:hypothetical protein
MFFIIPLLIIQLLCLSDYVEHNDTIFYAVINPSNPLMPVKEEKEEKMSLLIAYHQLMHFINNVVLVINI